MRASAIGWALYAMFIVYGSTLPFSFTADRFIVAQNARRMTLSPFISPETGRRTSMPDAAQNALLFVPFGILAAVSLGPRRGWLIGTLTSAVLLSVAVETAQLFTLDRVSSVGDVCFSSLGAAAGAALAGASRRMQSPVWTRARARLASLGDRPLLFVAAAAVLAATLAPFDPTFDVSTLAGKIKLLRHEPWQASTYAEGVIALVFGTLAFAVAENLAYGGDTRRRSRPAAAALGVFAAMMAVAATGAAQLITASRLSGLAEAASGLAGALGGGLVWLASPKIRPAALQLALLALAVTAAIGLLLSRPGADDYPSTVAEMTRVFELAAPCGILAFGLARMARRASVREGRR